MEIENFDLAFRLQEVVEELDAIGAANVGGPGPEPSGVRAICEHLGLDADQILGFGMYHTADADTEFQPRAVRYFVAGLLYGIGLEKKNNA